MHMTGVAGRVGHMRETTAAHSGARGLNCVSRRADRAQARARMRPLSPLGVAPLGGAGAVTMRLMQRRFCGGMLALGGALAPCTAAAQAIRIQGVTSVQGVDLRPLVEDSVPIAQATGAGPYRTLADGRLVRCIDGEPFCRFRRSGERVLATPLVQDLGQPAWGFGEGVSLHAHVRARSALGNDEFLWPRAGDEFDAIEAYVQLERERLRLRLGRQWASSGLGFYNYDGGALTLRRGYAQVEAFGGVSLVPAELIDVGSWAGEIDDRRRTSVATCSGLRSAARLAPRGDRCGIPARHPRRSRGLSRSVLRKRLLRELAYWRGVV